MLWADLEGYSRRHPGADIDMIINKMTHVARVKETESVTEFSFRYKRLGSARTRKIKEKLHRRDGGTCKYCRNKVTLEGSVLDHITPICMGGSNEEDNLTTACAKCNSKKSGKMPEEFVGTQMETTT